MTRPEVVALWSGQEIRSLRKAMRLTIEGFAAEVGVSPRSVSSWEAGGSDTFPGPFNQRAIDTVFGGTKTDVRERFNELSGRVLTLQESKQEVEQVGPEGESVAEDQFVQHPVDGKTMALVDGGIYLSGSEAKPLWVPSFYIDIYPTTNAEYARFVAAVGHEPPAGWDDPDVFASRSDHPVVFVTWNDATAYSEWAQKRLPTSHEWEKAARGARGNVYPWGSQMTPAKCNVRENAIGTTTQVDKYQSGVSPYGVYDMCGNCWEWCCTASTSGRRELKGSAFTSPFSRATPSNFNDAAETMCDDDTTYRCAMSYEDMQTILGSYDR